MAVTAPKAMIQLKDYEGKYNVLFPTVQMSQISPFHRVRVEEVKIDPNPTSGDVFKVGSRKVGNDWEDTLSLSKTAVMRLSTAAGIIWNWEATRVLSATKDYVLYQAVGAVRKPSGEWLPIKATKEIDLEVIEIENYESNLKTAKGLTKGKRDNLSAEAWAEAKTRTNMIQWRKNKLMRAETGAMLRVVRALLSIKQQYSPKELLKPFAVPTVDFAPDYSDPEVRRAIAEAGIKATSDLFGQSTTQQISSPQMGQPLDADEIEEGHPQLEAATEVFGGEVIDGGEVVEAEIDDSAPAEEPPWEEGESEGQFDDAIVCQGCDQIIEATKGWSPEKIADYSEATYGKQLCVPCQAKAKKAGQKAGAKK